MNHPSAYRGQEVVVLGLAMSGISAAKVFRDFGAVVTVNDKKDRQSCPEADELEALGISVVCGGHPDDLMHQGVALVVKNPGIPYSAPPVQAALALGIEVVTEVEVAYRICEAPIIGITGSNGKTTTTTWIGNMLAAAGKQPIVAGNIGRALCEAAPEATPEHWLVVELSSFQLKGTELFKPRIACLLNVFETHLDYHGSMEDYIASKTKIFANQTNDDIAIVNWDNATCRLVAQGISSTLMPFSVKERLNAGVYVDPPLKPEDRVGSQQIVYKDSEGAEHSILAIDQIGIPAKYNIENALAATAAALAAGVEPAVIAQELRAFKGVEHRLEYVRTIDGVVYYNNSKATNPAATIKAIEVFTAPIVLIAGGLERGMDYLELVPSLRSNVKAVVALGETRHKISRIAEMAGIGSIKTVDTVEDAAETLRLAVRAAAEFAESGDIVLLSPACASWDMFTTYEQRGRIFKESVHNL